MNFTLQTWIDSSSDHWLANKTKRDVTNQRHDRAVSRTDACHLLSPFASFHDFRASEMNRRQVLAAQWHRMPNLTCIRSIDRDFSVEGVLHYLPVSRSHFQVNCVCLKWWESNSAIESVGVRNNASNQHINFVCVREVCWNFVPFSLRKWHSFLLLIHRIELGLDVWFEFL